MLSNLWVASTKREAGECCWEGHLVLDPEPDRCCQRAERLFAVDLLADLDVAERVADARPHPEQPHELGGEAGKLCRAAGEDDLADAEGARLLLVELERGNKVAGELVHGLDDRLPHLICLLARQPC